MSATFDVSTSLDKPEVIKFLRERMRISHIHSDDEIKDLAKAALYELKLAGVSPPLLSKFDEEPLIKQAVIVYIKAEFGFDTPDADKYRDVFEKMKVKLTLSNEYRDKEAF